VKTVVILEKLVKLIFKKLLVLSHIAKEKIEIWILLIIHDKKQQEVVFQKVKNKGSYQTW